MKDFYRDLLPNILFECVIFVLSAIGLEITEGCREILYLILKIIIRCVPYIIKSFKDAKKDHKDD